MLLFRGDNILPGLIKVEKSRFLRLGMRLAGKQVFRDYPYEELYFLDGAKRVRDRLKRAKLCYIGGASTMQSLNTVMGEFDFVQMGRALIKDPAFVNHAMADPNYVNNCDHCNRCATLIYHPDGIRCVSNEEARVKVG
jgi:2,4-dienoyl-CoA reductase-like NADH-dependent reductase (Old Yellow Enzyme family)